MFVFKRVRPVVKNSKEAQEIIDRLEGFLTQESPQLVYWLGRLFEEQQNAVTYAELREAMLNGFEQQIWKWQEDYARFVNEKLSPVWIAALQAGAAQLQSRFNGFILNDSDINVKDWLRLHTGEFITNIGEDTRAAIKAILAHGQDAGWTAQQMAEAIRPCIGLTRPDALANTRYRQHVYDTLLKQNPGMNPQTAEKRAHEAALKYAAKQHRARAEMIANTELAFAYNRGYHEGVRQAMAQGLMGACEKVWRTAGTNRVCDKCLALNGTRIGFDDPFKIGGKELYRGMHETPPAHPRCRCVVQYVEYLPPARKKPEYLNAPAVTDADSKTIMNLMPQKMSLAAEQLIKEHIRVENCIVDYANHVPISYQPLSGKFILNPTHPNIKYYDMEVTLVHEIMHKLDGDFGLSASLASSINTAVEKSREFILANKSQYTAVFAGDAAFEMCISDTFSAITLNEIVGEYSHSIAYWLEPGTMWMEITANLMTIWLTQNKLCEKIIDSIPALKKLYREVVEQYERILAAQRFS